MDVFVLSVNRLLPIKVCELFFHSWLWVWLPTSALSHCHQTRSPCWTTWIGGSKASSRISNLNSLSIRQHFIHSITTCNFYTFGHCLLIRWLDILKSDAAAVHHFTILSHVCRCVWFTADVCDSLQPVINIKWNSDVFIQKVINQKPVVAKTLLTDTCFLTFVFLVHEPRRCSSALNEHSPSGNSTFQASCGNTMSIQTSPVWYM